MFDFPSPATVGQVVATGGSSWRWDGTKWVGAGSAPAGGPYLPLAGGTMTGPLTALTMGFNGTAAIAKPTISGACAGNTAIKALLTALASYGLVTDSTTA